MSCTCQELERRRKRSKEIVPNKALSLSLSGSRNGVCLSFFLSLCYVRARSSIDFRETVLLCFPQVVPRERERRRRRRRSLFVFRERERERFIRNNLHNGGVSGAAPGRR
jgi:hypothetical protein